MFYKNLALIASTIIAASHIYSSEFLSGDWGGARQRAHEKGIDFLIYYGNDLMGNPIGGHSQGFTNAGSLDTFLVLDLEKLAKIKGCSLYNSLSWCSGSSLSAKKIKNQFCVQQLYYGETYKLVELYLQESLFNKHVNFKLGRMCAGNDFLASPLYLKYVTGAINSNPISIQYNTIFSTYPLATWGAYLDFQFQPCHIKFGVYNCNSNIWENKYHGVNLTFESEEGVMWMSEWTYRNAPKNNRQGLEGNYTIGGYYITGKTAIFKTNQLVNNYGYYFAFDQMLCYQKNKSNQGLISWGEFLFAPADRNQFPFFFALGLIDQGMFLSRSQDSLCLGIAYGHYSSDLQPVLGRKMALSQPRQSGEMDIELNYWFQATQWLALTPVIQYIINPSGTHTIPNAFVAGMQVGIFL